MSDAAFPTGAFPSMTTKALSLAIMEGRSLDLQLKMEAELWRRTQVEAGVVSAMTPGERLRFNRKG